MPEILPHLGVRVYSGVNIHLILGVLSRLGIRVYRDAYCTSSDLGVPGTSSCYLRYIHDTIFVLHSPLVAQAVISVAVQAVVTVHGQEGVSGAVTEVVSAVVSVVV